ncbi:3-methyl-2-oxobutanoate hydroxymethyltransferase [Microbacterium pseudoresistens]|uniref:3-methyl-2-oxobutanoate hydroxymethyltransferase n=1 Tax=Microbacterium pseudoresistens TaxID=640634 RepID=A0A7Y9EW15_9MICO|nr:3-methyl-2-oxobutanoate hydroxymethyltransferase [Microbacterium pseudoresistens]NYD54866.1 hypothetical protein [Microbacterium pseudoresistens]
MAEPVAMSACARAITAEEAAFRIDYPLAYARSTRIVAFDESAEAVMRGIADEPWGQARFYTVNATGEQLVTLDGEAVPMAQEIEHSDSVIMLATNGIKADAVAAVGMAARERAIMTAGLLFVDDGELRGETLMAIRPHARILLVPAEHEDLYQLLVAIRA